MDLSGLDAPTLLLVSYVLVGGRVALLAGRILVRGRPSL